MTDQTTIYFVRNIKFILKEHGPVVSTFLAFLIDTDEFRRNTHKNYNGEFRISRPNISEETLIKVKAQKTCEKKLVEAGYITFTPGTHDAAKYTINYDAINKANPANQEEAPSEEQDLSKTEEESLPEAVAVSSDKDLTQEQGGSIPEDILAPSSSKEGVPTPEGINYNITKSITKTVSKSKPTYVPDGTESIDSASDQNLDCVEHTQISCIKKKAAQSPPGANAQNGDDFDEAIDIIEEYNRAMGIHLNPGEDELNRVLKDLDKLKEVRKYFSSTILNRIWDDYGDDYTASFGERRIAGFLACGFLPKLSQFGPLLIKADDDEIDQLLDRVFKQYGYQISPIIEDMGFHISYGSLEPIDASKHFPPKTHRELRLNLYNQHIKKLLSKDEKHDMIKLEVK